MSPRKSHCSARWQLGCGRGVAAGWERRDGCAQACPLPRASFCRVVGSEPPREELLKSAGAPRCAEPTGLPESFLSPVGVPAKISHKVVFGYLDLKGQILEYSGYT